MSASLHAANKVIGIKQSQKAITEGKTSHVVLAKDADRHVTAPIVELCKARNIKITWVDTKIELGLACEIDVGAAIVAILNDI